MSSSLSNESISYTLSEEPEEAPSDEADELLRSDSSGVYICKSIVNYLRHGNYVCKSEGIHLTASMKRRATALDSANLDTNRPATASRTAPLIPVEFTYVNK